MTDYQPYANEVMTPQWQGEAQNRIDAFMGQKAAEINAAKSPQPDPQTEFNNALATYQAQNGVSQGQNQDQGAIIKQAAAAGHTGAQNLYKRAASITADPDQQDALVKAVVDHPNEIDTNNSFQVMTTMAQAYKQYGMGQQTIPQMPSREQISMQDLGNIASGKGTNFLGLQQGAAQDIAKIQLEQAKAKRDYEYLTSGGKTPAAIQLANEIEKARALNTPEGDKRVLDLMQMQKILKLDNGQIMTDNGVQNLAGFTGATQDTANAKQTGHNISDLAYKPTIAGDEEAAKQQAQISAAAELERQKKLGSGDITDVSKRDTGRNQVTTIASAMRQKYIDLKQKGAAVSTQNSTMDNLSASMRQSTVGQYVGRRAGTEEQSIRNQINMQLPNLINSIRSASGMSAKAMDSNTELQFYLKMASDPSVDIESNLAALDTIEKQYGVSAGGISTTVPTTTSSKLTPAEQSELDALRKKYGR